MKKSEFKELLQGVRDAGAYLRRNKSAGTRVDRILAGSQPARRSIPSMSMRASASVLLRLIESGPRLLIPKLGRVKRALPNVVVSMRNLRSADVVRQVQSGELDLGLVRRELVNRNMGSADLGTLKFALLVPASEGRRQIRETWKSALARPIVGLEGEGQIAAR